MLDLRYLLDRMDDVDGNVDVAYDSKPQSVLQQRFSRLNEVLVDVIEDFSLVSFHPLQIEDATCLTKLIEAIDKTNGFVYTSVDWQHAIAKDTTIGRTERTADVQEQYVGDEVHSVEHDLLKYARKTGG